MAIRIEKVYLETPSGVVREPVELFLNIEDIPGEQTTTSSESNAHARMRIALGRRIEYRDSGAISVSCARLHV